MNIDIKGEVRLVRENKNGEILSDTGYIKNLILDSGLDYLGNSSNSGFATNGLLNYCLIGSGTKTPDVTDTALSSLITGVRSSSISARTSHTDTGDGYYKLAATGYYLFEGLNNVNITEVALASIMLGTDNYVLSTRTLIKDTLNNPTTITVRSGEILKVYYTIYQYLSTADVISTINMSDGVGGLTEYNVKTRLAYVGQQYYYSDIIATSVDRGTRKVETYTTPLGVMTATPTGSTLGVGSTTLGTYVKGSFNINITCNFSISQSNGFIRTLLLATSMGWYQIEFNNATDGTAINKTANDNLSLVFKLSWGRYEGVL